MKTFELALLRKSVDYFTLKTASYKLQLTNSLAQLASLSPDQAPEVVRLASLMS